MDMTEMPVDWNTARQHLPETLKMHIQLLQQLP